MRVSGINNIINKINKNIAPYRKSITNSNIKMGFDTVTFSGNKQDCIIDTHIPAYAQPVFCNCHNAILSAQKLEKEMRDYLDEISEYIDEQSFLAQDEAQEAYGEVMAFFKEGNKTGPYGTVVRKIWESDNSKVMKEYDKKGNLIRTSELKGDDLKIQEGIKRFSDGSIKVAKQMKFKNGELKEYIKGYEKSSDGSEKIEKELHYKFYSLDIYREDFEKHPDGYKKIGKEIYTSLGTPNDCAENIEVLSDGTRKIEKSYKYSYFMPMWFTKNQVFHADCSYERKAKIAFDYGNLILYSEDFKQKNDGSFIQGKELNYKQGKPAIYIEGLQEDKNNRAKMAKRLYLGIPTIYQEDIDVSKARREYKLTNNGWQKIEE